MEDMNNEMNNGVEAREGIPKGMSVKEYIKDLDKGLVMYDLEIAKLNKGKDTNTKKCNEIVLRLRKWMEIYEIIPWYMQRLSFLKPIKKRIRKRLKPHIKRDEASLLRAVYNLDDIVKVYNDERERLEKKCIEIEDKIKILEDKKDHIEEEKRRVEKLNTI